MAEYISKKTIYDIIYKYQRGLQNMGVILALDAIDKEVLKATVANVQPVKHGRWIKQEGFWNKNTVKCSLCGNYLDMNGVNGGRSDANFCPNCGARMDGEQND